MRSLILAGVVACALSCSSSEGKSTGATCPPGSTLTYENFGKAFFDSHCVTCHASREKPTLSTREQIQANLGEIDRNAAAGPNATNTAMPRDGAVSEGERKKLGEWLACGAK